MKCCVLQVWIGLFLALVITLYAVYLINRYFKNQTTATNTTAPSSMNFTQWLYYVLRVILIQSKLIKSYYFHSKRCETNFILYNKRWSISEVEETRYPIHSCFLVSFGFCYRSRLQIGAHFLHIDS